MVPEARLQVTEEGLVAVTEGWFVLNAREGRWRIWEGLGARLFFEGDTDFAHLGISLFVLEPGEPIGMYHREAVQEDFLVLAGTALLVVESVERPLRQWDFVHCPAGAGHMIIGAGEHPCVVIAVGAREHPDSSEWGRYLVDPVALRHGAGVQEETNDAEIAYARFPVRRWTRYRPGWLSGSPGSAAGEEG